MRICNTWNLGNEKSVGMKVKILMHLVGISLSIVKPSWPHWDLVGLSMALNGSMECFETDEMQLSHLVSSKDSRALRKGSAWTRRCTFVRIQWGYPE